VTWAISKTGESLKSTAIRSLRKSSVHYKSYSSATYQKAAMMCDYTSYSTLLWWRLIHKAENRTGNIPAQ